MKFGTKMQTIAKYQDIVNKQPIRSFMQDIFMKGLYSNSFIKLDSFYDQHIEVTSSESIQGCTTKDMYIPKKAMFIISYIYQKAIVNKENYSYSQ